MFLLDTNVVSELRKVGKSHPRVRRWFAARDVDQLFLSVIAVEELDIGIRRLERRDAAQGLVLRRWFDERVLKTFADRVLPITLATVRISSALHVPDPAPIRDALIAATALEHGLTVVTRNVDDFARTDVAVVDPWNTVRTL